MCGHLLLTPYYYMSMRPELVAAGCWWAFDVPRLSVGEDASIEEGKKRGDSAEIFRSSDFLLLKGET
jgi:hypothetical protein